MPFSFSATSVGMKFFKGKHAISSSSSRTLSILCRGKNHLLTAWIIIKAAIGARISREELFKYTNGRFLAREKELCDQRYLKFDLDQLCAVAASVGSSKSPVRVIEKMEGGFSKALLMSKEDGTEVVAKLPFSIAGPPKYLTASEATVLQYCTSISKNGELVPD
jgi:hypothetical protein